MTEEQPARGGRAARTHDALIAAGQGLLADGQLDLSILEITRRAGVGLGSFYNHFANRDDFFAAALDAAARAHSEFLNETVAVSSDPAKVFAEKFRLTGRLFRADPQLTGALVRHVMDYYARGEGLVADLRRNVSWGVEAGRFRVGDVESIVGSIVGAITMLGRRLLTDDSLDDEALTDLLCIDLLRMLGVSDGDAANLVEAPVALPSPLRHPLLADAAGSSEAGRAR